MFAQKQKSVNLGIRLITICPLLEQYIPLKLYPSESLMKRDTHPKVFGFGYPTRTYTPVQIASFSLQGKMGF